MTRGVLLGVDCGTQSTKALLVDAESGEAVAIGRADHRLISRPDGTREQEPGWWTDALETAVRDALAAAGPVEVLAIGVSGQQHGAVALDAAGRPLGTAKLWNDTSTEAACVALTERMGGEAAVHAATGNLFLPGYTAPKLEWLRTHDPVRYAAVTTFCLPHDYLNLWLTGELATEAGDASGTAYFDVRRRTWSDEVLAALDPDRDWGRSLPRLLRADELAGRLRPAAAAALGLPAGIPVSAGGGDNMCAAIGVGAVETGPTVISLGTSGTVFGRAAVPAVDPEREVSAFCDSTGGWLPLACVLNCTLPIDWIQVALGVDRDGYGALVDAAPAGARGLRFVPYLDGERTPNRPAAAGSFVGLRLEHGRPELARAVLEGVTASLAHAAQAYERTGSRVGEVLLVGGGARDPRWAALLSDWLDVPVRRPAVAEAAARGAAIQAGWAALRAPLARPVPIDAAWEPGGSAEPAASRELAADYRRILGSVV